MTCIPSARAIARIDTLGGLAETARTSDSAHQGAHIDRPDLLEREQFSISDLTEEFGCTARALRFYEDEGLIAPRRVGLARIYSKRDRARLAWIMRAKNVGFSLGEISQNVAELWQAKDPEALVTRFIEDKLVLGNASQVNFGTLLKTSDVITLHVPETPQTKNMIGEAELSLMKQGCILINASRGTVVDIDALTEALRSNKIAGAAIDVFPVEPKGNDEEFVSPLRQFDNVILTPHIGGSTQEAQENIGFEVAGKLVKYSDNGSTLSAVNFPEVSLPEHKGRSRLLHIHKNQPGVLTKINEAFAKHNINIAGQYLQTNADIGYVVIDIDSDDVEQALNELRAIPGTLRARVLH